MRCIFCGKRVFGNGGVTIPSKGVAHAVCFNVYNSSIRSFKGMVITELEDGELEDLRDMVLSEINFREGSYEEDELF